VARGSYSPGNIKRNSLFIADSITGSISRAGAPVNLGDIPHHYLSM